MGVHVRFRIRLVTLLLVLWRVSLPAASAQGFTGVLTQHNDLSRSGQNLNETVLTPANVNSKQFGKLFSYPVNNQIYAQPLYVPNLPIPGLGTHDVVYVATEGDTVYAFDADGLSPTVLWSDNFTNPSQGVTTISCTLAGLQCNVYPTTGITGTPVIDPTTRTMYVLVRTAETSGSTTNYVQRLHALALTTGAEKFGGPVVLSGSVKGTGTGSSHGQLPFDTLHNDQRPGLVLANGNIYIGWAGSGHGWLMAYGAQTLKQIAIVSTTPNGTLGGVWQSGNGFAVDSNGDLYLATGDGTFDANTGGTDYGDTVLKLSPTLQVLDYFTPMDQDCRFTPAPNNDLDLGSGGPMILPKQTGGFSDEIIQSGKGGSPCDLFGSTFAVPIYLLNRDGMGGYNPNQDQDIQTVAGTPHGYWSNPAFWRTPTASYVYYSGQTTETGSGDYLKQYTITSGALSTAPVAQSSNLFPVGSTPSISANGTNNGIVWAIERSDILSGAPGNHPAVLYAYNASNVATMLYNSRQSVQRDATGCGNKFQTATIAKGKVYVATQNELDVFGVLPSNPTAPAPNISNPCLSFTSSVGAASAPQTTTLTNLGPGNLTISSVSVQGINPSEFNASNNCGSSLAVNKNCTITVTFTPSVSKIPQQAYLQINDNAIGGALTLQLIGTGSSN
jgi:hypothetical protein